MDGWIFMLWPFMGYLLWVLTLTISADPSFVTKWAQASAFWHSLAKNILTSRHWTGGRSHCLFCLFYIYVSPVHLFLTFSGFQLSHWGKKILISFGLIMRSWRIDSKEVNVTAQNKVCFFGIYNVLCVHHSLFVSFLDMFLNLRAHQQCLAKIPLLKWLKNSDRIQLRKWNSV